MTIKKETLIAEGRLLLFILGISVIIEALTRYAPPTPTVMERYGGAVVGAAILYSFLLACRLLAKGIVRLIRLKK